MAKLYYAKMHVAVGDYIARPGEVIEGDLSELGIDRLLHIGAICECSAPAGTPYDEPTIPGDSTDSETRDPDDEENVENADGEEAETGEEDVDCDEEPAPAPIDVMDGITPAPAENAAPKATRKERGGKTK